MKKIAHWLLGIALIVGLTAGQSHAQVVQPQPTLPPGKAAPQNPGMSAPQTTADGKDEKKAEGEEDLIIIQGPKIGAPKKMVPAPAQLEAFYKQVWRTVGKDYNDPSKLGKDWAAWESKYNGKIKTFEDLDAAIKAMVESLGDRWTSYTSAATIDQMRAEHKEGIIDCGLLVRQHANGQWLIDGLSYGSPAQLSKLREGDAIKALIRDGKRSELKDLNAGDINKMLNGKVGEKVTVVATWDNADHEVELTFAKAEGDEVLVGLMPGKIGYIRLPTFVSEETVGQFVQALGQLYEASQGDLNGLVFDLRYNGGGLVNMALLVSSLFVEQGTIVKTTTRDDRSVTETSYKVGPIPEFLKLKMPKQMVAFQETLQTLPIVILTNGSTASASEITTGALRDNKRAHVIGTHTFGKAVGFHVNRLANGGVLQVTSLSYLTPAGTDIGGKGIDPDQVVERPRDQAEGDDAQLEAAHAYLMVKAKERAQQMRDTRDIAGQPQQDPTGEPQGIELHPLHYALIAMVLLILGLGVTYGVSRIKRRNRGQ